MQPPDLTPSTAPILEDTTYVTENFSIIFKRFTSSSSFLSVICSAPCILIKFRKKFKAKEKQSKAKNKKQKREKQVAS